MWQELAAILSELNKVYLQLVALGKKKRGALVAVDMKTLEGLTGEEEVLTAKLRELEQKREKTLIHLAAENPSIRKDTKMEEMIHLAPNMQLQQVLTQLHLALSKNTAEARDWGEGNSLLIRGAMRAVAYHLNRISGTTVEPAYGQGGHEIISHRKNYEFDA